MNIIRWLALFVTVITTVHRATSIASSCVFPVIIFPDLRGNKIKRYYMNISNRKIANLCDQAFAEFENLNTLDLSKNLLTIMPPGLFEPLQNIIEINLNENQLTTINFNEFVNNRQLMTLRLNFNYIKTIEHIKSNAEISITKLRFSGNKLTDVSELCKLTKLESLDLSYNQDLDFNTFKPSCWSELQSVYLANVGLKRLNNNYGSFNGLKKLEKLDLSENNLEVLCVGNIPELPKVTRLFISYNQLQSLDAKELQRKFPKLRELILTGNLWSCDYFRALKVDLIKWKVNVYNYKGNCVIGANSTELDLKLEKCQIKKEGDNVFTTHLLIWSFLILDCVLFITEIFLSFYYFLH